MYVMRGLLPYNSPSGEEQLILTPAPNHTGIANQNPLTTRSTTISLTTTQFPAARYSVVMTVSAYGVCRDSYGHGEQS